MINISHISKQYGTKVALDDVSLTIPENSIIGLVGPNGAGKSTLLKIITQIIDQDDGTISLDGCNTLNSLYKHIGYLPEQRSLYNDIEVMRQFEYFASIKGVKRKEAKKNIDYWLKTFGIEGWKDKKVSELSKGMQQKIQFISCLLHNPKYVLMDEPLSGVDPVNFDIFTEQILDYHKRTGATIILSTHNMKSIEKLCSHIVFLVDAKVALYGDKDEIYRQFINENQCAVEFNLPVEEIKQYIKINNLDMIFAINKCEAISKYETRILIDIDSQNVSSSECFSNIISRFPDIQINSCHIVKSSMDEIFKKVVTSNSKM